MKLNRIKAPKTPKKKYGHFFLYLPATDGQRWLERVKKAASKEGYTSVSGYIRDVVDTYLQTTLRGK